MNNKTYDYLKWIVLTVLPALAVLVSSVGNSLTWEYTEITVTVLNAVTVFLGASLGLSSVNYHKNGDDENG
ncbi:phage holin [Enterococcus sp. BWR-S5]|uniref:phage holin n=1 Tax=Enterococcus sp. BWR-S5 TaxID=2787714 RepID=UPI001922B54D|nr:phage holin [Enterococcus sp. BWR-S5]MBL1223742.1 phage holin [Enterococcus sp. BWR-S5]